MNKQNFKMAVKKTKISSKYNLTNMALNEVRSTYKKPPKVVLINLPLYTRLLLLPGNQFCFSCMLLFLTQKGF